MKDRMKASTKAPTMVRPASWMVIGVPVASGATRRTARAKRTNTALLLESPLGNTETRARPSGVVQSDTRSAGSEAAVTGAAGSRARS